MPGLEIAQIFIKHTANAATKVLTFPPWENPALQSHMKGIFVSLFLPCVKGSERGSKGFIYENAQKKVLEKCNFCPGKSLILLNKKVYEPCTYIPWSLSYSNFIYIYTMVVIIQ
jgi:hypothetical protein